MCGLGSPPDSRPIASRGATAVDRRCPTTMRGFEAKLAGGAGVTGVAVTAIGLIVWPLWQAPSTGASAAEISAYVLAHRSAVLSAMVLYTLAPTLFLIYGAGIWIRLRPRHVHESLLPACFALGMGALVTLIFVGFVLFLVLVRRVPDVPNAKLLYDLGFAVLAMSGAPTAVAAGSYAASVLRHGQLPRFTAWYAVLAAAAHLALLFSFVVPSGFFSLEGGVIVAIPATLFAWIGATSVAMLRIDVRSGAGPA